MAAFLTGCSLSHSLSRFQSAAACQAVPGHRRPQGGAGRPSKGSSMSRQRRETCDGWMCVTPARRDLRGWDTPAGIRSGHCRQRNQNRERHGSRKDEGSFRGMVNTQSGKAPSLLQNKTLTFPPCCNLVLHYFP